MIDWCRTLVFTFFSIHGCWTHDGCLYGDNDVRLECPKLEINNGGVCYKRQVKLDGLGHLVYWIAMFTCNEGYYLHGPTEIRCILGQRYGYWTRTKPTCIPAESTIRSRIVRTALYNTTPSLTRSKTTANAEALLTTLSSRSTNTSTITLPTLRVHVQLITNTSDVNSTAYVANTTRNGTKDNDDNTIALALSAILSSVVAVLICAGILLVFCRKMKRAGSIITTSDHQTAWTTNQTNTARYSAKDQIVVLPLCDIKTATVLHDTRIYPTENKWLIPGDYETPAPYNSLATTFEDEHEEEEEEGTLTNAGYEDDDYIHSIFQRLHDGAMEESSAYGQAKLSDPAVKSEKTTEFENKNMNSEAIYQHRFDHSHVDMEQNPLDEDKYSHLHGRSRRCSGEATYSHLYDSWLDRHQRKGDHANLHNVLHTDTTISGNKEIDEESGLY